MNPKTIPLFDRNRDHPPVPTWRPPVSSSARDATDSHSTWRGYRPRQKCLIIGGESPPQPNQLRRHASVDFRRNASQPDLVSGNALSQAVFYCAHHNRSAALLESLLSESPNALHQFSSADFNAADTRPNTLQMRLAVNFQCAVPMPGSAGHRIVSIGRPSRGSGSRRGSASREASR